MMGLPLPPMMTTIRWLVKGIVFTILSLIISGILGVFGFGIAAIGQWTSAGMAFAVFGFLLLILQLVITGLLVEYVDRLIKL